MSDASIKEAVKKTYGAYARSSLSSLDAGARRVAEAFGYSSAELNAIPAEANMGLSCGNPTALASLRAGEVVVDLGSGGGLDVFLAAPKVGPTGRVIGIDMSPDMIARARHNAQQAGIANVEFHLAEIESLPFDDASIDCVISNCVLNLVPDKAKAFAEIVRVLKPGGRLAASDIALKQELPPAMEASIAAYTGCISGAIPVETYRRLLLDAGFDAVDVVDTHADLNAYAHMWLADPASLEPSPCGSPSPSSSLPIATSACCGSGRPGPAEHIAALLQSINVNDYAASVRVFAVKPRAPREPN